MGKIEILKKISIKAGEVLVGQSLYFRDSEKEAAQFLKALYKKLDISYSKFYKMDLISKLGFLATELLVTDQQSVINENTAIIFANASSSLNTDVKYQDSLREIPSPGLFVYTLPNIVIGEICIRHKIYGEQLFLIQQSYNREFIMNYINELFESNTTDNAIIGWLEMNSNGEYNAELEICKKLK